jgi:hypothetical protein
LTCWAADLAERYATENGAEAMRLTPKGAQVARTLATDTAAGQEVLDALPDAIEAGTLEVQPPRS